AIAADGVGALAASAARDRLKDEPGRFKTCLVIVDDAGGGWTNRYAYEYSHRIEEMTLYKRGWIEGFIWTSEPAAASTLSEEIASAIHRAAYIQRHGPAGRLSSMLAQEGAAMARAGCVVPALEADDLAYTRDVLQPLLGATDRATAMACLFGDEAAHA